MNVVSRPRLAGGVPQTVVDRSPHLRLVDERVAERTDESPSEIGARLASGVADAVAGAASGPAAYWLARTLGEPLEDVVARPGKAVRARLASIAWRIGGGRAAPPAALAVAIEGLHAGSLIIDDIEDGSRTRRGAPTLHLSIGVPRAINAGSWLYFRSVEAALSLTDDARARAAIAERINATLLRCHEGQALDLGVRVTDLARDEVAPVARAISARKTGALFALAAWIGATAAGAPPHVVATLDRFAEALGDSLQRLDDVSGLMQPARRAKGDEDLRDARVTWPWAVATTTIPAGELEALLAMQTAVSARQLDPERLRAELVRNVGAHATARALGDLRDALACALEGLPAGEPTQELVAVVASMEGLYVESK